MSGLLKKSSLQEGPQVIGPLFRTDAIALPAPARPSGGAPERLDAASAGVERHARLLDRIAGELVDERARLLSEIRPELLQLVLAIAREVLGREVAADPSVIENTLSQALQNLHFATRIVVRLHPDDLALLESNPEQWRPQTAQLEWLPDPAIERGGCMIESDRGGFDATLEAQLRTLHQALAAEYNG